MKDQKMKTKWILAIGKYRLPKPITRGEFVLGNTRHIIVSWRYIFKRVTLIKLA